MGHVERMTNEPGRRRAEIMTFLGQLSGREKLVALAYLANDAGISARIPDLARTVQEMHRAYHRVELLKITTERSNLDLQFLARRKGCNLRRVEGPGDRWRIIPAASRGSVRAQRAPLSREQALDLLRSLPDQDRNA
jgi:hypothetical protein